MTSRRFLGSTIAVVLSIVVLGAFVTKPKPSRFVYVWAGNGSMKAKGLDMIAVIDANPASPKYGTVVDVLTVDSSGVMPHHSELELPARGPFFVNDYGTGQSF